MMMPCEAWLLLGRAWYDALLLAYIAVFFLVAATLLSRTSRLGWAMTAVCLSMTLLFGYGLSQVPAVPPPCPTLASVVIRLAIAVPLTWAIVELVLMRRRRQTFVVHTNE